MALLSRLLTLVLVSCAAYTSALSIERSDACTNTVVFGSSTVMVGDNAVIIETFACADSPAKRGLFDPFSPPKKTTATSSSIAPAPTPANVCGQICTDSCSSGGLPPISQDCQTIYNSLTILQGSIDPTFTVPANGVQQLTFGTCRVFFNNLSSKPVSSCWDSLSEQASAAGTLCFPPTQPLQSLGVCNAGDGSWQIGVGHS
ncbi:hypothetical protein BDY19DRAFT_995497 [Irpex rosettiformis]|uniref:Uncharacterized protein n=1 Tax=Irpex rosettiformis TaxID=378272 RepID=A0ACB8TY06_9APHY|nr:hypothetical protein BDY19DRAFT_995497 [Irpex rosettiformis]